MSNLKIQLENITINIPEISLDEIDNIEADIERLRPRGVEAKELIPLLMSCIDLTSLEATDTIEKIKGLAKNAKNPHSKLPPAAAVCVYPTLIGDIKNELAGTDIKIATVAGGFPHGQVSSKVKYAEVAEAVNAGANEVDLVCSRKLFHEKIR